jgi:hypothetical protein
VYPNADEITTLSLEPAGDPRALGKLNDKQLKTALATVATELSSLYRANFSVTMNMITAMRAGQLPTQLIFSLSALALHDYEPIGMRYFKLTKEGDVQYEIDFKVDKTGQRKAVNGYDCQEVIMTIAMRPKGKTLDEGGGMVITSDMWMAPRIPAMQEQVEFMQRYMKKLFGNDTETMARDLAQALAMYPQLKDGMERMKKEAVKLDGTAVLTTMKIETVMSPEQAKSQSEGGDKPKLGLGGIAGGLGGMFGKKKKAEDAPKDEQATAGPKNRATFMTSTTELLEVLTSVGPGDVDIPAGFKQK